jgi:hypothetical protein
MKVNPSLELIIFNRYLTDRLIEGDLAPYEKKYIKEKIQFLTDQSTGKHVNVDFICDDIEIKNPGD